MINTNEYNNLIFQISFKTIILLVVNIVVVIFLIDNNFLKLLFILMSLIISTGIFLLSLKKDIQKYNELINEEIIGYAEYKSILTATTLALLITDKNNILFFNNSACNLFRRTSKELETCSIFDLIHERYKQQFVDFMDSAKDHETISLKLSKNNDALLSRYATFTIRRSIFKGKERYILLAYEIAQLYDDDITSKDLNVLYKQALNNLPIAVTIFDKNGKLIFLNEKAQANPRISSKMDFSTIIEDDVNRNILNSGFHIALDGVQFVDESLRYRSDDGDKWMRVLFSPIKLPNGNIYVEYAIRDISKYINEIIELRNQLNYSSQFSNGTENILIFWDLNGNFIEANHKFYEVTQTDSQTLQSENLNLFRNNYLGELSTRTIIFNNDNLEKKKVFAKHFVRPGLRNYYELAANGNEFEVVIQCCFDPANRVNQKYEWYNNRNYPITNEDGRFSAFVSEFSNVTDYYSLLDKYDISKKYLDAIANNFYAGILFIIDKNNHIVFIGGDKKIRQNVGFAGLAASSRSSFNISQVLDLNQFEDNFFAAFEGNYTRISTQILDTTYEFQFVPIRDEHDIVTYCMGIAFDIGERDKYEKQLIFQKNFHEKIFYESAIPSIILDTTGKIVNGNREFYHLTNTSLEQITQTNIYDANSMFNQEIIHKGFEQAVLGHSPPQFEINISAKNNTSNVNNTRNDNARNIGTSDNSKSNLILICTCYPIADANQQVHSVIINLIDVTEMRILIKEIQKTQAISNIVTSNFPDGILIILDSKLNFLLFDGKDDIRLLNMHQMNVIGKNLKQMDTEIVNIIRPYVVETITSKRKMDFDFSFELHFENEQKKLYYNANIIPVLDPEKSIEYIYVCLVNITNMKQLEETVLGFNSKLEEDVAVRTAQLQETTQKLEAHVTELQLTQNKLVDTQDELAKTLEKEKELSTMKSHFISLMSHEFRTPLTVIQTCAYLLDTYYEIQNREQFEKNIQKIISAIDVMTKLLDNILFLDEVKVHTLALVRTEVNQFINSIKDETVLRFDARQKITIKSNKKEVIILTDEKLLKLIVSNLLSNAIKYSPDDSDIIIEFEDMENEYCITVQDFGPGLSDDILGHLFDTFIRSQTVTNVSGSGLGLSITQNCVDMLRGTIRFETEKNVGTKFIVKLPKLIEESILIADE